MTDTLFSVLLLYKHSCQSQSLISPNATFPSNETVIETSPKPQFIFNRLIDHVPSNPLYYSVALNILFGFFLVHFAASNQAGIIEQGCTLPNGVKVVNGWENLYNNCQEKCVCRENQFQCSPSGCDLTISECKTDYFGHANCESALLVLYQSTAMLIHVNGKIRFL